jgi:phosphoribosylamine--glycine ligase
VLYKTATCDLANAQIAWREEPAVSVVIASAGYPGKYEKGKEISGLEEAASTGAVVFHAGTALKDGKIVSAGGRVLGVSALGKDIADAIANAYKGVEKISFDGAYCRKDIGAKALKKR